MSDGYAGLPFRDRGRDRDGIDCWGLSRLALREGPGIDLPLYGAVSARDAAAVARAVADSEATAWRSDWRLVADRRTAAGLSLARRYDLVVMADPIGTADGPRVLPSHFGVVMRYGRGLRLLHIDAASDSHYARLTDSDVVARFHGLYRHVSLEEAA